MKHVTWALKMAIVLASLSLVGCGHATKHTQLLKVAITYIGPHELISQIVAGFRSGMGTELDGKPVEIIERHANGDETQISSMLNGVISMRPDVLATITTPVSQQALKNAPAALPIVFIGVTDPCGAGLAKTLERPEFTTGVSDVPPLERTLALIRQLVPPGAKRIGFPYSPNEEPAVYSSRQVEALAAKYGFVIDARAVTSTDQLPSLARALIRGNDAIMVGADNGMFEAAPMLAKMALDAHKPFFAADSSSVKAGAVAGVTVDYTQVGIEGAHLVQRVLRGEREGDIPVASMRDGQLEINSRSLKILGIKLPPTLAAQVKHTY
ncbi:MAG TPA: ABC transporter substrate-binding protein [Terracidiphilus sp.]|nr:ABC transporter substrate-binding protein [Terracidiphilus sp.]